jgi:hypothetical protein
MFTWICPRCGREVPPSYTECPSCGKAEQAAATGTAAPASPAYMPPAAAAPPLAPPQAAPVQSQPSFLDLVQEPSSAPPAPPQPAYRSEPVAPAYQAPPPPVYQAPAPPAYTDPAPRPPSSTAPASFLGLGQAPPPQQPTGPAANQLSEPIPGVTPRPGLPIWLMTIIFAAAFVVLVGGVYWLVDGGNATSAKPAASVVQPATKPGAAPNPYQKYIEVSGVRFLEGDKKKPQVKFVVTNHSGADITGLGGSVTILGRTQKEAQAAGSFEFSTSIGPWESKDLTVPLVTQLEMIELPDWQFVSTNVQITSPAQ